MFGKYNGFVSKARVSACMYFLVNHYSVYSTRVSEEKICLQPADGLALLIAFNSFSEYKVAMSPIKFQTFTNKLLLLDAGQLMNQLLDGDGSRSAMQILLINIICNHNNLLYL